MSGLVQPINAWVTWANELVSETQVGCESARAVGKCSDDPALISVIFFISTAPEQSKIPLAKNGDKWKKLSTNYVMSNLPQLYRLMLAVDNMELGQELSVLSVHILDVLSKFQSVSGFYFKLKNWGTGYSCQKSYDILVKLLTRYTWWHMMASELHNNKACIRVICWFTSIIEDQIAEAISLGIRCVSKLPDWSVSLQELKESTLLLMFLPAERSSLKSNWVIGYSCSFQGRNENFVEIREDSPSFATRVLQLHYSSIWLPNTNLFAG